MIEIYKEQNIDRPIGHNYIGLGEDTYSEVKEGGSVGTLNLIAGNNLVYDWINSVSFPWFSIISSDSDLLTMDSIGIGIDFVNSNTFPVEIGEKYIIEYDLFKVSGSLNGFVYFATGDGGAGGQVISNLVEGHNRIEYISTRTNATEICSINHILTSVSLKITNFSIRKESDPITEYYMQISGHGLYAWGVRYNEANFLHNYRIKTTTKNTKTDILGRWTMAGAYIATCTPGSEMLIKKITTTGWDINDGETTILNLNSVVPTTLSSLWLDMQGNNISLYANGELMGSTVDDSYSFGTFGFRVGLNNLSKFGIIKVIGYNDYFIDNNLYYDTFTDAPGVFLSAHIPDQNLTGSVMLDPSFAFKIDTGGDQLKNLAVSPGGQGLDLGTENYYCELEFNTTAINFNGLKFRKNSTGSEYLLLRQDSVAPSLYVDSDAGLITSAPLPQSHTGVYKLAVLNTSTNFKCYFDDELIIDFDNAYRGSNTYVGIYWTSGIITYDNLLIKTNTSPNTIVLTELSKTSIKIEWTINYEPIYQFIIERKDNIENVWQEIGYTSGDYTSFIDYNVNPLITYTYRVRGIRL